MTPEDYKRLMDELKEIEGDLNSLAKSMDILSLAIKAVISRNWKTNTE